MSIAREGITAALVMNWSRIVLGLLCVGLPSLPSQSQQKKEPKPPLRVRITSNAATGIAIKLVAPREIGIPGQVLVDVLVSREGRVLEVRGVSGEKRLQQLTRTAVRNSLFMPYYLNGEPTQFLTLLRFQFNGNKGRAQLKVPPEQISIPPPPLPDLYGTKSAEKTTPR